MRLPLLSLKAMQYSLFENNTAITINGFSIKLSVVSRELSEGTLPCIKPYINVFASALGSTPRILSLMSTKSGLKDLQGFRIK